MRRFDLIDSMCSARCSASSRSPPLAAPSYGSASTLFRLHHQPPVLRCTTSGPDSDAARVRLGSTRPHCVRPEGPAGGGPTTLTSALLRLVPGWGDSPPRRPS